MYYIKHRAHHSVSGAQRRARMCIAIILVLAMFIVINARLHPIVNEVIHTQAQQLFSTTVSDSVTETLAEDNSDFVLLSTDGQGAVTAIQTDTAQVNLFRAKITEHMLDRLERGEVCSEAIPIGSLTGLDVLSGKGARLPLTISLAGGVSTELHSEFAEAGINQTRHTLRCTVTAEVFAVMSGHTETVTLTASVPVAESVIVGGVPESYTYVNGDQSDTIGRIFDYGDPYGNDVLGD